LTLNAYRRLKAELNELIAEGRPEVSEKIRVAREHGDIKENAEYDAAKNEQGLMESKIRKLQEMLRDPEIVEAPADTDAVGPGMLVTVRPLDEDDPEDETYLLAEHAEERAPGARTVTVTVAVALLLAGSASGNTGSLPTTRLSWYVPGGSDCGIVTATSVPVAVAPGTSEGIVIDPIC